MNCEFFFNTKMDDHIDITDLSVIDVETYVRMVDDPEHRLYFADDGRPNPFTSKQVQEEKDVSGWISYKTSFPFTSHIPFQEYLLLCIRETTLNVSGIIKTYSDRRAGSLFAQQISRPIIKLNSDETSYHSVKDLFQHLTWVKVWIEVDGVAREVYKSQKVYMLPDVIPVDRVLLDTEVYPDIFSKKVAELNTSLTVHMFEDVIIDALPIYIMSVENAEPIIQFGYSFLLNKTSPLYQTSKDVLSAIKAVNHTSKIYVRDLPRMISYLSVRLISKPYNVLMRFYVHKTIQGFNISRDDEVYRGEAYVMIGGIWWMYAVKDKDATHLSKAYLVQISKPDFEELSFIDLYMEHIPDEILHRKEKIIELQNYLRPFEIWKEKLIADSTEYMNKTFEETIQEISRSRHMTIQQDPGNMDIFTICGKGKRWIDVTTEEELAKSLKVFESCDLEVEPCLSLRIDSCYHHVPVYLMTCEHNGFVDVYPYVQLMANNASQSKGLVYATVNTSNGKNKITRLSFYRDPWDIKVKPLPRDYVDLITSRTKPVVGDLPILTQYVYGIPAPDPSSSISRSGYHIFNKNHQGK